MITIQQQAAAAAAVAAAAETRWRQWRRYTEVAPTLEAMEPASLHALLETCEMSKP